MKTTSQFFKLLLTIILSSQLVWSTPSLKQYFKGYNYYKAQSTLLYLEEENSCIYDKQAPEINFIFEGALSCYEVENLPWQELISVNDNCTPASLLVVTQKDSVDQACNGRGVIFIYRTFTVKDRAGNKTSYMTYFKVSRPALTEIVFPDKVDWYCPSSKGIGPDSTGWPTYNGYPINHYCGITVNYKDATQKLCGGSKHIKRHWSITDCCTLFTTNYDQSIYIHDTTKPVIACLPPLKYSTNVKECYSHQIVPSILTSDACSPDGMDIYMLLDGKVKYRVGNKIILSRGNHTYEYVVTDACGNISSCTTSVEVYDGQPPLLVCNAVDVCLLTETTTVCAKEFVSEYWDDCDGLESVNLKIRKLEDFCNHPEETEFGDCITICCSGNQKIILVEVRAIDKSGNSISCITEVNITSKLPLEIKCQDTLKLSCGDPIPNTPAEVNYCGDYTVTTKTVTDTRNSSGMGTIVRRYIVTTTDGRKDSCQTVIIIGLGANAFGADDVTCPAASVDITGCTIPNLNGIPGIGLKDTAKPCTQININLKLDTFTNLGTPCIRVRRTWTIKDALQPALNITCVQNINIVDNEKPVLSGIKDTTVNAGVNCNATIDLPAAIATDCDTNVIITNSLNAQGANISSRVYPIGMTIIKFFATDKCGNKDSITIKVTVVSSSGFSIVCQPDTIVNCGVNFVPRPATINASCTQIATNILRSDTIRNKCAITKINFKRIVTDTAGRKDSCTFMVTFRTNDTLFCDQIVWAKDTTLLVCNKSIHPDSIKSRPSITFTAGSCARLNTTFKDSVLVSLGISGCTSVTRRIWTVSDTCAVPAVTCRDTQLITVTDNSAPVLKIPKDTMVFLRAGGGTDTLLTFLGNATATDCDPNVVIKNVIIGRTDSAGASLIRRYALGTTNVVVIARDACGNITKDTLIIQVKDTIKPSASCKKSNNYLSDQGLITLKANQFDGGSTDNTTPAGKLRFSWTKKLADTVLEVNCNYIKIKRATGDTTLDTVRVFPFERNFNLWVTDSSGNQDTCKGNRFLAFFDTLNICGKAAIRTNAAIQGKVTMLNGKNIPNVILSAIGGDQAQNKTDQDGSYLIKGITPGMYKVFPYKNDDPLLGVSTADLINIQKHVLGLSKLDSPEKLIAADINNDGDISSIDLLELRKLILGLYDQFPQNTSWRFFDQSIMARVSDLIALKDFEKPFVEARKDETIVQNFTGIKIGDVNGSADPKWNSLEVRTRNAWDLLIPNYSLTANDIIELPISANVENMDGVQMAIKLNQATIISIKEDGGVIPSKYFNETLFDEGVAKLSWINPSDMKRLTGNQILFTLYVRPLRSAYVKDLVRIHQSALKPEAYFQNNSEIRDINLEFTSIRSENKVEKLILSQNAPNPFNQSSLVKFTLPADGIINWTITDMTGRIVEKWKKDYRKGDHQVIITRDQLGASGIYYYRMEYKGYTEVKKLILMD